MEEKKWIKQAKKGNHEAFALLFKEHYPFLVKYLIKVTMNRDLAEEIAQDTMAKCVEKIHQYNGKSKFSSWLITIATNRYIDLQRKSNREKDWQREEMKIRKLKWEMESRNEEWNDVLSALGRLSEEVRLPIILKHYYGYSYDEIGQMTDLPPGTVKSRVHHGITKMRKELKIDEKQT
ncbi:MULTISPECIES: RNA polymerase sigma factor SigY [Bacillaceae]|uniref:RNA polymerase sigma factor SigY n=1 Tax=Bacillaceae TaxID=186817 RepID=UPI001C56D9E2|nr:RNA polymerase sigma factor SigY [Rossellomorea sp. YZS02]MBW3110649.1 RNA polymerase sigma factor SigY [Bacillus sp. MCCB 382]MDX8343373.1 RNA polymerase sigma factor SigY [Rossellomorea sp. YZS02]